MEPVMAAVFNGSSSLRHDAFSSELQHRHDFMSTEHTAREEKENTQQTPDPARPRPAGLSRYRTTGVSLFCSNGRTIERR
ncbi:uncharacterized protein V6R79_005832 [Siganus canaliculatus]